MPGMPNRLKRLAALTLLVALSACDAAALVPPQALAPTPPAASTQSPAATGEAVPRSQEEALAAGRALLAAGDYEGAAETLAGAVNADPNGVLARDARLALAESFGHLERWPDVAEAVRPLAEVTPHDETHARALFLLARAHEESGVWEEAVATYERYRALATPIAPYARLRQAALERALGRAEQAAAGYEEAARSSIAADERARAYERAIAARVQLGQASEALGLYGELLDLARVPAYRARLLLDAGRLAAEQGQAGQAREWLRGAVTEEPAAAEALAAAELLLADPQGGLAPAAAARVFAAHARWSDAVAQFDAAIPAAAEAEQLALRRERALALRALGDFPAALGELAAIGAADPNGETGRQAQLDWVQTVGQSGEPQRAIAGYREYANAYPEDPRAPEALGRAAILLDGLGDAEGAAQQRLEFARRYPEAPQAARAHFAAGMYYYGSGRYQEALEVWDELRRASAGGVAAQASYWMARSLEAQGEAGGDSHADMLDVTREAAPDSYYARRAAEQSGVTASGQTPIGAPISDSEWRDAESWLASWTGQEPYSVAERGYPPEVAGDPAVLRAGALAEVGLLGESIGEWRAPLESWREDPGRLYLLARMAHERGVTYVALLAAERLARLASAENAAETPDVLRRLIFPTPYHAIVLAEARERQLDPLALYALMRQESLFNPAAVSWVGARGLAQVMPATGQGIAQALGAEGYDEADLLRPAVSIRFGAFYLGQQLGNIDGSLQGALAAYNGGPGNAWRWAGGETVADPDLFVERIDYPETRDYVKLVYGYYGAYERIYRVGEQR
jgi:soluble lytic murein transglycosylase